MDLIHQQRFEHKPLMQGKNIRILALEPSHDFNSEIRCRLTEQPLDKARDTYEALSYVWGSKVCDCKIICDNQPLYVTRNCLLALRYLRKRKKPRLMWVDAICIDQSSNDERGHQVELMGEIYKYASNVIIWLGEAQPGTKKAFRNAHHYYRLIRVAERATPLIDTAYGRFPSEMLQLLDHAWFQRVWTFQELLLASRATVYSGHHSLTWEAFLERATCDPPGKSDLQKSFLDVLYLNTAQSYWNAEVPVINYHSSARANQKGNKDDYGPPSPAWADHEIRINNIGWLWGVTQRRSCSEPLDRLYGLYGLLRNLGFSLPKPDYNKTVPQVAQELTSSILEGNRSLSILYYFANQRFTSGPSWALDWKSFSTVTGSWGIVEKNHSMFRQNFKLAIGQDSLGLEGILYGTVHPFGNPIPKWPKKPSIGDQHRAYVSVLNWLREMLNLTKSFPDCLNSQPTWEAFFIAYVKGCRPSETSHSQLEKMVHSLLHCGMVSPRSKRHIDLMKQRPKFKLKQLHKLNDDELRDYICENATMKKFMESLTVTAKICSEGTPFRTSGGWIGISLCCAEPSDVLALLHGSSVPAILRPVGEQFQLVGFASVEGIPDHAWPIKGDEEGVQSIVLI